MVSPSLSIPLVVPVLDSHWALPFGPVVLVGVGSVSVQLVLFTRDYKDMLPGFFCSQLVR